ncbi:MAG TPA: MlaD family protein [Solirubrobacterales bacterium]
MRGLHQRRFPNWALGFVAIVVTVAGVLFAFYGELPWSKGYELEAVFPRVQGLNPDSPVRVAGIDVGEVTAVEHAAAAPGSAAGSASERAENPAGATVVTMELADEALPIHADATLRIRPRLFLEGNYFIELETGSPSAPELDDGATISYTRTSAPVQLDEVLTSLDAGVREDLQVALDELGGALVDEGGAEGLREVIRSSGGAAKQTAIVNEALLGTEPGDLSGLVRNLQRVTAALDRNEPALQGLISNGNEVTGALAAEGAALERSVADLPGTIDSARPTLDALNASFPPARAFARDALPGVRALPAALDATTPLLRQVRGLVSEDELRGGLADLRPAIPRLASLTRDTTGLLAEARLLSSCFSEVVIPWSHMTVPDPETPPRGEIYKETAWGLTGISGESRNFDGNGPWARVLSGTGTNLTVLPPLEGTSDQVLGLTPFPLLGARPAIDSSAHTPLRRDVACEGNDPPNLASGQAAPPPEQRSLDGLAGDVELTAAQQRRVDAAAARLDRAREILAAPDTGGAEARRAGSISARARAEVESALAEALGWEDLLGSVEPGAGEG